MLKRKKAGSVKKKAPRKRVRKKSSCVTKLDEAIKQLEELNFEADKFFSSTKDEEKDGRD